MFNINYTYIIITSLIVANFVLLIIVFMSRAPKKTSGQNRRQSPLQDRRRKKNEGEKLSAFRPLHSVEDEHIINECLANLLAESNQHKAVGLSLRKIAERLNASYCGIFQFDCGQKTVFKFAEYPREKRALTNPPCPIGQSLRKKTERRKFRTPQTKRPQIRPKMEKAFQSQTAGERLSAENYISATNSGGMPNSFAKITRICIRPKTRPLWMPSRTVWN